MDGPHPVIRSELESDLRKLGLKPGGVSMLHCRMSAMGWVVGGSETIIRAIINVLGPLGTLMALTGWEYDSYHLDEWPEAKRIAYLKEPPVFDPALSESQHDYGRLPERIRTWPGAHRSRHPEASFAAIGNKAEWMMSGQPCDHPYGPDSPLAKLVEADGDVLMLGAPLETITLLHHAEELARVPNKRCVTYRAAIRAGDEVEWRTIHDIDTSKGAFNYEPIVPRDKDAFEVIAADALGAGIGIAGKVGDADSSLFPAPRRVKFATAWMEKHFGDTESS